MSLPAPGKRSKQPKHSRARELARQVLEIEAAAIRALLPQLDSGFDRAVDLMRTCRGRIVCTGMGKSGHVMKKVAATLASTGTPSLFLHPAEAIHGDLGMIVAGDVMLAASFSGTTTELLQMLPVLKRKAIPLIAITGSDKSPLAAHADVHLSAAIDKEACPLNLAPTASTTATLALGDALAMVLLEERGFTPQDFAVLHPGGNLGKRLLRVDDLMHQDEAVPRVNAETPLREAIYEMSRKGLGITAVVDSAGGLLGVISDGDLRRLLSSETEGKSDDGALLGRSAAECMKREPKTIAAGELAPAALKMMEDHRITALFVCETNGKLIGVLHIHDLWGLELF